MTTVVNMYQEEGKEGKEVNEGGVSEGGDKAIATEQVKVVQLLCPKICDTYLLTILLTTLVSNLMLLITQAKEVNEDEGDEERLISPSEPENIFVAEEVKAFAKSRVPKFVTTFVTM